MFKDAEARKQSFDALIYVLALASLLVAKGVITKEELDIATNPLVLAQGKDFESYVRAIKVALQVGKEESDV